VLSPTICRNLTMPLTRDVLRIGFFVAGQSAKRHIDENLMTSVNSAVCAPSSVQREVNPRRRDVLQLSCCIHSKNSSGTSWPNKV